jgi:Lrp/AsnC family leucine-responsive transcriptional regulator
VARTDRTKFGDQRLELDSIDRRVLAILQEDCKTSLSRIGEKVGLSAPALLERIRKLERAGIIRGYHAVLDSRRLGLDLTAFIGVSMNYPKMIESFERAVAKLPELLECHHVTGAHSLLLKVKTYNTQTLEQLISRIRAIDGVQRTDTMVVFSTRTERTQIPVELRDGGDGERRSPTDGERSRSRRKPRA